jgi:hypothetical protein
MSEEPTPSLDEDRYLTSMEAVAHRLEMAMTMLVLWQQAHEETGSEMTELLVTSFAACAIPAEA